MIAGLENESTFLPVKFFPGKIFGNRTREMEEKKAKKADLQAAEYREDTSELD